jgi:urocanate hydratase
MTLGGCLFYVGELDEQGRAFVVAGNVAAAASLTATSDQSAQKQAIRLGIVDFLVTTLDEALRILKNEVRKRSTVAVCVGVAPEQVEREMLERGVLPDLVATRADSGFAAANFGQRTKLIDPAPADVTLPLLIWEARGVSAGSMPKLDQLALDCLAPGEAIEQRWARLAPRYSGRSAEGMRVLRCAPDSATRFRDRVKAAVRLGEVTGVELRMRTPTGDEVILESI